MATSTVVTHHTKVFIFEHFLHWFSTLSSATQLPCRSFVSTCLADFSSCQSTPSVSFLCHSSGPAGGGRSSMSQAALSESHAAYVAACASPTGPTAVPAATCDVRRPRREWPPWRFFGGCAPHPAAWGLPRKDPKMHSRSERTSTRTSSGSFKEGGKGRAGGRIGPGCPQREGCGSRAGY